MLNNKKQLVMLSRARLLCADRATVRTRVSAMAIAKADFIEGMARGMAVLESFDTERQRLNARTRPSATATTW